MLLSDRRHGRTTRQLVGESLCVVFFHAEVWQVICHDHKKGPSCYQEGPKAERGSETW